MNITSSCILEISDNMLAVDNEFAWFNYKVLSGLSQVCNDPSQILYKALLCEYE